MVAIAHKYTYQLYYNTLRLTHTERRLRCIPLQYIVTLGKGVLIAKCHNVTMYSNGSNRGFQSCKQMSSWCREDGAGLGIRYYDVTGSRLLSFQKNMWLKMIYIVYKSYGREIGNSSGGHGVLPFHLGKTWFKLAVTSSNWFLPVVAHDK